MSNKREDQLEGLEQEFIHEHIIHCEFCSTDDTFGDDGYAEEAYKEGWRISMVPMGALKGSYAVFCKSCYKLRNNKEFWS